MARQNPVQYINFYTPGSEAYKYDFEPVRKKTEVKLPKPRRQKKIIVKVDPVALLGICVAAVMLITLLCGVVRLAAVRQQQAQMADYVQRLEEKNEQLQMTYEAGYDLDEIYEIATAMGMIPADQAQQIRVQAALPVGDEEPTAWENFCLFLAGLFA